MLDWRPDDPEFEPNRHAARGQAPAGADGSCLIRPILLDQQANPYDAVFTEYDGPLWVEFSAPDRQAHGEVAVSLPGADDAGVLAPGSRLRALVVPGNRRRDRGAATKLIPRTRIPWADLLKRVFQIEILRCVRCGGRREVIGVVRDTLAARTILEHLGLDTEGYEPMPARAPPQLDLAL